MNIEAKVLSKIYGSGENQIVALNKVNLEIASSDFISIMGPSGSGKSPQQENLPMMARIFIVLAIRNFRHFADSV